MSLIPRLSEFRQRAEFAAEWNRGSILLFRRQPNRQIFYWSVSFAIMMTKRPDPELLPIHRPRCPDRQTRMITVAVASVTDGLERRTFECRKCGHGETELVASDPLESDAAGWTAGELRRPNEQSRFSRDECILSASVPMDQTRKDPRPEPDLDEQAQIALDAARRMKPGPERTEAMKRAGILRNAADLQGLFFARRGRPPKT